MVQQTRSAVLAKALLKCREACLTLLTPPSASLRCLWADHIDMHLLQVRPPPIPAVCALTCFSASGRLFLPSALQPLMAVDSPLAALYHQCPDCGPLLVAHSQAVLALRKVCLSVARVSTCTLLSTAMQN